MCMQKDEAAVIKGKLNRTESVSGRQEMEEYERSV